MKRSTLKRIKRRWQNLPVYFVDTSVFLEVIFKQPHLQECTSFFNRVGYHYRLKTSTLVLGEIIESIQKFEDEAQTKIWTFSLLELLKMAEIEIIPISFECIGNIPTIRDIDCYLESSDTIIFSSALTENCNSFVTLDSDFSIILSKELGIIIKKPSEA